MNRTHARIHRKERISRTRRMAWTTLVSTALVASAAATAEAQVYVQTSRTQTYTPIGSIPGMTATPFTLVAASSFLPADDEGFAANIPIGFSFNFLGTDYSQLGVSSNGWVGFGSGSQSTFAGNTTAGNAGAPNAMIAYFWDDLAWGSGSYGTMGTAPNRIFVLESVNYSYWSCASSTGGSAQIWLYEGPARRFEVRYGGNATCGSFSASAHWEGANGAPSGQFGTCTPSCTNTTFNSQLSGNAFSVSLALEPELTGSIAGYPRGAFAGQMATGNVTLTNLGVNTATGVISRVYLSTNNMLDAADVAVGSTTNSIVNGNTVVPVTITIPPGTANGDYFLLLRVDDGNNWTEINEADNVVAAAQRFATSYELSASAVSVTNTNGVNPGEQINFSVTIRNDGVPRVGALDLTFHASADQIFDAPTDPVIGTATVMLVGTTLTETVMATVTMPQITPGTYYPVVRVDPANALAEANELNNLLVGQGTFGTGPDFAIGALTIPTAVVPGQSASIVTRVDSVAVPYTGNLAYRLWASLDQTLSTTTDINLGTYSVAFTGQAQITDTRMVPFATSIPSGRYYVIAVADPLNQVVEVTEMNNSRVSATTIVNAVDFAVTGVSSTPAVVEVGTSFTVNATARSQGVQFTGNLPYSVFLSSDNMFDPGDQRVYNGLVFIAGAATAPISATFPVNSLPGEPQFGPGTYNVIVVMDPANTQAEADETNNAAVGPTVRIRGADLQVDNLSGPGTAFIGLPYDASVTISNTGEASARAFQYAYYLSTNDIIRVTDRQIFVSATATIASSGTQTFEDRITLPAFTSTQTLWLGVIVDVFSRVPETAEGNNTARIIDPLRIVFPIPDLRAEIVGTATAGAAGEDFAITRILVNQGVADAATFNYTYYLSTNPTISNDDTAIGTFSAMLGVGQDDYDTDVVNLPSTLAPGTYYVGLVLDADERITEVDETNNTVVGPSIQIFRAAIQFVTDRLPRATIGVPYEVGVYTRGGPLATTFAVQAGALPPGITLDGTTGIVSGSATTEGLYTFTLRASSGTAYADKDFSIRVTSPTVDLRVATPSLPSAIVRRAYSTRLIAVGGTVPYEWSNISDLPAGLTLSVDGVLEGTPLTPGALPVTVRVRDALGNSASKELVLKTVNANQTIQITQIPLPSAVVGLPYCDPAPIRFEAQNGVAPYSWAIVGDAPAGMTLSGTGELCGTPETVGLFPITIRVQDQTGLFDTALFILEVEDGSTLAISTFSLEKGEVNKPYTARITAIRGTDPYTWSVVEGWGALPAGFSIAQDGTLSGSTGTAGVYAFVVQVTDGALRTDVQPLSLEIEAAPVVVNPDDGCSCATQEASTEGPWTSLFVLGVISMMFLFRRRSTKRLLVLAVATACVLGFTTAASAQFIPGTPYQRSYAPITYADLPSPTIISCDIDDGDVAVPLPFPFHFYESMFTGIRVGYNGAIGMGSASVSSLGNTTPGSTASPNGYISPFWDDLRVYPQNGGCIGYQTQGTAPNRTFTVEWRNISRFGSTGVTFSMQVRLFEGAAARFEVDYGPMNGSASFTSTMAMEDDAGGRPIYFSMNNCTTSCSEADYRALINQRVTLVQDPGIELQAVAVNGPALAFLGAQTPVNAVVQNLHGNAIGPFVVEIFADTDRQFSNPISIGTRTVSLSPFQTGTFAVDTIPPQSMGEGQIHLRVNVDSTNAVAEVNEMNNVAVSAMTTRLLRGRADLAVQSVSLSAYTLRAGDTVNVYTRVRNVGGEPAGNFVLGTMLSTNPVISAQDVQLDTTMMTLAAGVTVTATRTVTIPADANSGTYYIGVLADVANAIEELSESNNGRAAFRPIQLTGGTLAVLTQALPIAYVRVSYVALFAATGGGQMANWELVQGRLPQGVGLVAGTGELFGRPTMPEMQTFTVQVTSDGQTATRQLTLVVSDPSEPLTIVSRSVPPGVVGQEYNFPIVATGGAATSSLSWSATGLPEGLEIGGDGSIIGTPVEEGESAATIRVSNGTQMATREITLEIRENANLLIIPNVLSTARFGEAYSATLEAAGGMPPVTWTVQLGRLPAGITLSPSGELSGTPSQVGTFRFVVEARDAAAGQLAARDVNTFELRVADVDGFKIDTASLADATVNQGYDARITASGGLAPYDWVIEEGRIPEGLIASVNPTSGEFLIAGQPTEPGIANLLVTVIDSQNRFATRALSLRVLEAAPVVVTPTDEGCSCHMESSRTAGASSVLMMLAIAGLFGIRRRK